MKKRCLSRFIVLLLTAVVYAGTPLHAQQPDTLWLRQVDLSRSVQEWKGPTKAYESLEENPLRIAGRTFDNGLASHTEGALRFELNGKAEKFHALIGLDDTSSRKAAIVFSIIADDKEVFSSAKLTKGTKAVKVDLNLKGVKYLALFIKDNGTGVFSDQADYANAYILYKGTLPYATNFNYIDKRNILTPPESPQPKINSAKVFGVRPGHPFMYTVAATGKRPMTFSAENLPNRISLDPATGIITGVLKERGESLVTLKATNELGTATRTLRIIVGDKIALTPPMGWNGYNRFGDSLDYAKVKAGADAMVSSGLINHGWTYINIDDGWSVKPGSNDPKRGGIPRDSNGMVNANGKFPDMKELTDYIHSKGLKAGLYSSPGYLTCSNYTASYQFEDKDALQWAKWGFDYIKYDYCFYEDISKSHSVLALQKPYVIMRHSLDKVDRDIVYSLSQYGMGDTWKWGEELGANSWRTTGDLIDTWESLSEGGFSQAGHEKFAGPGHWNDPDMLVVGLVGWGELQYPTRLRADEQYTHISLWCLLNSPLLIGCDIVEMDEFTKSLLTNDEVLEVNQDPLGMQAARVFQDGGLEIWVKDLEDGSKAVGLFNRNANTKTIKLNWDIPALNGNQIVRDLWRQQDEGVFTGYFSAAVPAHGVKLITIRKEK